ncbi:unnamed protein product, partial [Mesorhabditis spiculigera]
MWQLLLLLAASAAARPEETSTTKEVNYRKYIGEQDYKLPLLTRLVEPLVIGQTIHTVGTLKAEPKRVDFNFLKGGAKDADMPLHFSIRFDEAGLFSNGKFVYNTYQNGNWSENEQRMSNPFKASEEFDLRVRILDGKYHVFANRKELGFFEQRQDLKGIDHVSIRGDLVKLRLFHYGGRIFPNPYTAVAPLKPGKRLDVSGLATGKRFNVNLYKENKEFALQISVRFDEGAVVRNAMTNNVWGKEEREGAFPLEKGQIFDLTIINEEYSFQIFFNGKRFATFAHRGSPSDLKTIGIDGDLEIHAVNFNDAPGI